jgi:hypothetical protein
MQLSFWLQDRLELWRLANFSRDGFSGPDAVLLYAPQATQFMQNAR